MSVLEGIVSFPPAFSFPFPSKLPGITTNSPTCKSSGPNLGFAISSAVTVVPSFTAIKYTASPASTMYSPVGVVVFGKDGEVVELKVDVSLSGGREVIELEAKVPVPRDSMKRIERLGERAEESFLDFNCELECSSCK
jgi:hypothetical protein